MTDDDAIRLAVDATLDYITRRYDLTPKANAAMTQGEVERMVQAYIDRNEKLAGVGARVISGAATQQRKA